jgi:hypothetical protein
MIRPTPPTKPTTFEFNLCASCRDKYRALSFDSTGNYSLCPMPLASLVWPDEHPDARGYFLTCCAPCKESIRRLCFARTHLWRNGEIPNDHVELWKQANGIIPDWPGFKRLSLDEKQMKSLDACREELDDLMGAIVKTFPKVSFTDKGGGQVDFTAERVIGTDLIRPASNPAIFPTEAGNIIRCPKCREFIDSSVNKCRYCNSDLNAQDIRMAVAQRG